MPPSTVISTFGPPPSVPYRTLLTTELPPLRSIETPTTRYRLAAPVVVWFQEPTTGFAADANVALLTASKRICGVADCSGTPTAAHPCEAPAVHVIVVL